MQDLKLTYAQVEIQVDLLVDATKEYQKTRKTGDFYSMANKLRELEDERATLMAMIKELTA
jgi:hypothetical protein